MVISNWVEKKLEERRLRRLAEIREQGRQEGFEQGRAFERERIQAEANGHTSDDEPPHSENGR